MKILKLYLIVLVTASYNAFAMDMEVDSVAGAGMVERANINLGLENALKNANLDWFEKSLPALINKYPTILTKKFYFGDDKVDIRAMIIAQAKWAKLNGNTEKYERYVKIYNLLKSLYTYNLPNLDSISISVIRAEINGDSDLINRLGLSATGFLQGNLKRPIGQVGGKLNDSPKSPKIFKLNPVRENY